MGQQKLKTKLSRAQVSQREWCLLWLSSVVLVSALSLPLPGKAETWVDGSGYWDSVSSWQEGAIPDGVGDVATFNAVAGLSSIVQLNGNWTLGVLNLLGNPGEGYGFANGAITFSATSGNAIINVSTGCLFVDFQSTAFVDLASDTVINTSGTYARLGSYASISGPGALIKEGPGTVNLFAPNSYAGGTHVDDGVLWAGIAGAFVNNNAYIVNGGALHLNGYVLTMSSLSGSGGSVTLGNADLNVDQTLDTTYSGAISGTGGLIKSGLGTLTLSANNIYTGGTTISAGTLVADHQDSGGVMDATGTGLITLNGGRLHSSANSSTLNDYLIVGGTTSTISTTTETTLWLNGGSG